MPTTWEQQWLLRQQRYPCPVLQRHQHSTGHVDAIVTGDLGLIGSELLCDLVMKQGYDISAVHRDCGAMLYDRKTQDTHAGGSGCGCSASMLCGHFLPALQTGAMKQILFAATGALMSPTASQQGESIPGISHLVDYQNTAQKPA